MAHSHDFQDIALRALCMLRLVVLKPMLRFNLTYPERGNKFLKHTLSACSPTCPCIGGYRLLSGHFCITQQLVQPRDCKSTRIK